MLDDTFVTDQEWGRNNVERVIYIDIDAEIPCIDPPNHLSSPLWQLLHCTCLCPNAQYDSQSTFAGRQVRTCI
jgi:hypothetical protein